VVAFSEEYTLIAHDGQQYELARSPIRLGNTDMAIAQFSSGADYPVAEVSTEAAIVGERVYAAGFPMYHPGTVRTTFELGIEAFQFTEGEVSLLLSKSLDCAARTLRDRGYRLGYTNDIEVGMSGGPILNARGLLIGINGRVKHRDPAFGVYAFADGTEPEPAILEKMIDSSWGIPISTYLQFLSLVK